MHGCKRTQPLSTGKETKKAEPAVAAAALDAAQPRRRKLADTRRSVTHKFSVAGFGGYITVGLYDDGQPGEIFITLGKGGSILSGFADAFATAVSFALQHGVELRFLVDKFTHVRFEPSGFTGNPDIPIAKSIVDYVFRWMALQFLPKEEEPAKAAPENGTEMERESAVLPSREGREREIYVRQADAPPCSECGSLMIRKGACYACVNCGSTSGCS